MDQKQVLEIILLLLNRTPINIAEQHAANQAIAAIRDKIQEKPEPTK